MNDPKKEDLESKRMESVKLVRRTETTALSFNSEQSSVVDRVVDNYYSQFKWIQVDEQTNLNTNMFQAVL